MGRLDRTVVTIKTGLKKKVEALTTKRPGDSQIVVALVLIAVAIGLCIIFRNSISNVMTNLFNQISSSIDNLANGAIDG